VLSDQLSDYEGEDGYTTAHVDIRSSRSARDFGRASGMLHTEEVTGSNTVSPTAEAPDSVHEGPGSQPICSLLAALCAERRAAWNMTRANPSRKTNAALTNACRPMNANLPA
jgi:hypothetical protein